MRVIRIPNRRQTVEWASRGQVALVLTFVLIVGLAGLDALRPRVTSSSTATAIPAPARRAPRLFLPGFRRLHLAGATAAMTFLAGNDAASGNELWGVTSRAAGLLVRRWDLGAGHGRSVPVAGTTTFREASGAMTIVGWGRRGTPALLVARNEGSRTAMMVFALRGRPRMLARGLSAARPSPAGGVRAIAVVHWTNPGLDLLIADRRTDGSTQISFYAGELGDHGRVTSMGVHRRFPASVWSLAILSFPRLAAARPRLVWIAGIASSGRIDAQLMPRAGSRHVVGEQVRTALGSDTSKLRYTVGLGTGEQYELYAIEPRSGQVNVLSFVPTAG